MSWTNADGLTVLMHEEQGEVQTTGKTVVGVRKALVIDLEDASTLGASYSTAAGPNDAFIPANALIVSAHFVVDTAFAGATATLNIGLYNAAGTAIDADGIDATIAVATLAADAAVVCDGVLADGTQNVGAADAYVGFDYDTAAFTAGSGKLVVEYIEVL